LLRRREAFRVRLDQPHAEMNVAEQPALVGESERRPTVELPGAADVVQQRGGEQQVDAQPWMQLSCLAAERRHPDRVLEEAARV
jgi:hypothetical protein